VTVEKTRYIEFFRDAYILVPKKSGERFQTLIIPASSVKKKHRMFCNCSVGKEPDCQHAELLSHQYETLQNLHGQNAAASFQASVYRMLFKALDRAGTVSVDRLSLKTTDHTALLTVSLGDRELLQYHSTNDDRERFISRISPKAKFSRAWLLDKSASFVESEYERAMRVSGHRTVRMQEENSLWHRLAYHCFMEFGNDEIRWGVSCDGTTGTILLQMFKKTEMLFTVNLTGKAVAGIIDVLIKLNCDLPLLRLPSGDAGLVFRMRADTPDRVRILPCARIDDDAQEPFPVTAKFCYGSVGYDPSRERFFRFGTRALQRIATGWNDEKTVTMSEFSDFLKKNRATFSIGTLHDSGPHEQTDLFGSREADDLQCIIDPPVIRSFDRIELHPRSSRGSQWTIELIYCCGDVKVNLKQLLDARARQDLYLFTPECIVDMKCKGVTGALAQCRGIGGDGVVTLSGMSLMLLSGDVMSLQFEGDGRLIKKLKGMFSGKPRRELSAIEGFRGELRSYQNNGVNWLHYLYDYYLGGLLCDEMGLGKTIQIIACITSIRKSQKDVFAAIICPTSVLSHWQRLVERFAPALTVQDYTKERMVPLRTQCDVLLMSYGIMRNDSEKFAKTHFDLVIFDEIQQLKNRDTAGYRAACQLRGRTVIGLTGTPVENSADDLQALFNIVLPGLTIDVPSEMALLSALSTTDEMSEVIRFRNRIKPFLMRRLKADVLRELPGKTEENRFCPLSPYQQELYREAVRTRGKPLLDALRDEDATVPYMHIFSLMSYLKQVCNTPALAAGRWEEYTLYESGKWELFKELLDESLGSGEKVVVFTQFLAMVDIFSHYLGSLHVDHEILTGSSRNRDKRIRRFNDDPECRVFIGSLKAGGVGIDLTAASVVIHYDRWWNAAREDQATDRVHRFGQTRGVQVFKLVTENTLEERIDQIIEQKKLLSQTTLTEDDPDAVKHFTREELIELLSST